MIDRVIREKKGYDVYDVIFILLDSDKLITRETLEKASEHNIRVIESVPCVEGLLLSIVEENYNFFSKNSEQCKREFETKHLNKKDKLIDKKYCKLFSKEKIEAIRGKIQAVDGLLKILKNE